MAGRPLAEPEPERHSPPSRASWTLLLLHDVEHRQGGGAGERVTAVGSAQAARLRGVQDFCPPGDRRQGKTTGKGLSGNDEVGNQAVVFTREELPGAAKAGLNLVGN